MKDLMSSSVKKKHLLFRNLCHVSASKIGTLLMGDVALMSTSLNISMDTDLDISQILRTNDPQRIIWCHTETLALYGTIDATKNL